MPKVSESKENLVTASNSVENLSDVENQRNKRFGEPDEITEVSLTQTEKQFLLSAERGDCATVKRIIEENKENTENFDINCVDPINRSALISAIENENIELIKLLLEQGIKVKDALLHAIKEEYVEAVESLLYWEEQNHISGQPYSWEAVDRAASTFTQDITPLILAAHRNNYEILKILLDRGATLPMPHDVRCGCDECVISSEQDSLRHSHSRINAYKALSSSSLIALSSRDPILTAFELSWELRRLSRMETEFRIEYNEMRKNCQEFSTSLLDHSRTSYELEVMLNYNATPGCDIWEPGDRQSLERLKMAIKYKQKAFVAHPNVQQLLAAIWYEGLPGFRRKGMTGQITQVAKFGSMFPVYSMIYMMAPHSKMGQFMKKPFVKFICHSSSYAFFLMLLGAASQRVEFLVLEIIGHPWLLSILDDWKRHERGALPGFVEFGVIIYIVSSVWHEIKSLWHGGIEDYIGDLWNIIDFISNSFYVMWIGLRFTSWYTVTRDSWAGLNPWYPREQWDPFDPMLLSEGAFAAGMIFSFLKLVHIFSINPHLGPLQVSLGRMIIDIIKFFFIYTLVLFAFGCGLNQLMWYYADLEKRKCYHFTNSEIPDFDNHEKACAIWRRFANLFETSQSLFWASFGLVDLMAFELQGIKSFTRFWALLMFGSYSVINIIVLLNMLIAMMSNSYQIISERSDVEWKFARSKLWMSYFEDGDTVPPPFNLMPSVKLFKNMIKCGGSPDKSQSVIKRSYDRAEKRHENVMKLLIRRYVTAEQRKRDDFGITEDDVMEIRQDISTLRFELIEILHQNGMKTPRVNSSETAMANKKGKVMERRILKDFQIGFVEGIANEVNQQGVKDVFGSIAKAVNIKKGASKGKPKDWNTFVRKNTVARDPIGSTRASIVRRSRKSLRRHIIDTEHEGLEMNTDKLVEYNPKLSDVTPTTRVAYVKFMAKKIKGEDPENMNDASEETPTESKETVVEAKVIIPAKKDDVIPASKPLKVMEHLEEDTKDFRARTPIPEDPNEERTLSPEMKEPSISSEIPKTPSHSILTIDPLSLQSKISRAASPDIPIAVSRAVSPDVPTDIIPTYVSRTVSPECVSPELTSKTEELSVKPESVPSVSQIPKESLALPSVSVQPLSPGKSKATGRKIAGWL